MKEITSINGPLTIDHARKAADIVNYDILGEVDFDFEIIISGSIVHSALGMIDRCPNDIDLYIKVDKEQYIGEAVKIISEWEKKHNITDKKLNGSEHVKWLAQVNMNGICVDCFINTEEHPCIDDNINVRGYRVMQPFEVYRRKADISSLKVAMKTMVDLGAISRKISKITAIVQAAVNREIFG